MSANEPLLSAEAKAAHLRGKQVLPVYALIFVAVSIPFSLIHLTARPDDAPITPVQHMAAAIANFSGPWGVLLVRLVDFPNAGLRAFSWPLAVGLTGLGILLVGLPLAVRNRPLQVLCAVAWMLFAVAWFVVGLIQIASGLL